MKLRLFFFIKYIKKISKRGVCPTPMESPNHWKLHYSFNILVSQTTKKTSKLCVVDPFVSESTVTKLLCHVQEPLGHLWNCTNFISLWIFRRSAFYRVGHFSIMEKRTCGSIFYKEKWPAGQVSMGSDFYMTPAMHKICLYHEMTMIGGTLNNWWFCVIIQVSSNSSNWWFMRH